MRRWMIELALVSSSTSNRGSCVQSLSSTYYAQNCTNSQAQTLSQMHALTCFQPKTPGAIARTPAHQIGVIERPLFAGGRVVVNRRQAVFIADHVFDLHRDLGVFAQELLGVFTPLADRVTLVAEERAALLDHAQIGGDVQDIARFADALVVHNVELCFPERWRDLVLGDTHARPVADDLAARLDRLDAADIEPHTGVKLKRPAPARCLRIPKHHANFLAKLVGEHHRGVGLLDRAGELAQRLAHQPRLQADVRIAHFALKLGAGYERRHTVEYDHVQRAAAHQRLGDVERLLGGVRLRNVQIVDIYPDARRIRRVERVLHVDERADTVAFLRLGDGMQAERRLTGAFRAINLGHTPARDAAGA